MIYKYKVIDQDNNILVNSVDLNNKNDVISYLRDKNFKVIWIKEDSKFLKNKIFRKMNLSNLQFFLYRLHILSSSNINLPQAIEILTLEEKNKNNKKLYKNILESLNRGNTLYFSMEKTGAFPDIVINMIKIGEQSSNLKDVFKNLSLFYREEINFNKKIKSALYYPILLIFVTIIIVNFLTVTILPQFMDIFYENSEVVPLTTKVLMKISGFINNNYIYIILTLIFILIFLLLFLNSKEGKKVRDKILIRIEFYRNILIKRFISEMCLLLNSNITLFNSLDIVSNSIDNVVFSTELKKIRDSLNRGISLSSTLKNSKIFTNMFVSLIKVSEETAKAKEIFNSLDELYSFEIKIKEERFIKLLEPIIIIILSAIVGFVVMAVAIPMFDIVNGI